MVAANLIAVYRDHRLLPGVEVTIKLTTCPLNYGNLEKREVFETKFRIVVPISETRPYKPDEPFKSSLVRTIIVDIR